MLCPLNKAKVIYSKDLVRISFTFQCYMGIFHSFKNIYFFCYAFSFVLFTVHVVKNVQVTTKLSPQNHFITKHILFLKQVHQLS